jgi:hypothetical protein
MQPRDGPPARVFTAAPPAGPGTTPTTWASYTAGHAQHSGLAATIVGSRGRGEDSGTQGLRDSGSPSATPSCPLVLALSPSSRRLREAGVAGPRQTLWSASSLRDGGQATDTGPPNGAPFRAARRALPTLCGSTLFCALGAPAEPLVADGMASQQFPRVKIFSR